MFCLLKLKKSFFGLTRIESRLEKIFSIGISCMSLAVIGRGEKMFGSCGGFRFGFRIIYGTAVFIKSVF